MSSIPCECCEKEASFGVTVQGWTPKKNFVLVKKEVVYPNYEIYLCKSCYNKDVIYDRNHLVTDIDSRKL